jgi:hypothetical protein
MGWREDVSARASRLERPQRRSSVTDVIPASQARIPACHPPSGRAFGADATGTRARRSDVGMRRLRRSVDSARWPAYNVLNRIWVMTETSSPPSGFQRAAGAARRWPDRRNPLPSRARKVSAQGEPRASPVGSRYRTGAPWPARSSAARRTAKRGGTTLKHQRPFGCGACFYWWHRCRGTEGT